MLNWLSDPHLCPRLPTSRLILGRVWVGSWGELAGWLGAQGCEMTQVESPTMAGHS
jgi:hypothetical protein